MLLTKSLLLALLFLIFHSHVFSSSSSSTRPPCRPETRTALLNFSSNSASDFNKSADCCTWPMVECDSKTGHATSLNLSFLNETIITPKSSLFSLSHLQRLIMNGSDGLNIEIGSDAFDALTRNLTRLQYLNFDTINMSSVPPASLMNLSSSLTFLRFRSCQLTGKLPHNLSNNNLGGLTFLSLSSNSLSGPIPSWIYSLPNLERLYLGNNSLQMELESLDLSSNNLSENNLGGQRQSVCSNCTLPNLTALFLFSNSFSGLIPSWIYSLPNLEWLDLRNNRFSGEIGEFQTTSLSQLWLTNNSLQGAIPTSLFKQMELEYLDLASNNLSENNLGGQRQSMCSNCTLPNLAMLSLFSNSFGGPIPSWIYSLPNLVWLSLERNRFSGEIGEFQTTSLYFLSLNNNNLQGAIPRSLFQQMELEYLHLSANNFTGQLHSMCSNCTLPSNLTTLRLYSNSVSGPIPSWIYSLPNLEELDLNNNRFSGEIAEFQTTSLSMLLLTNNKLQGVIPRSLFQQMELKLLDLSSNNFTGTVELQELSKLENLSYLDLSDNNLFVTYNCTNCTFENLNSLRLSSCNLTEFPHFLRSSKQIEMLDLSNNQIQGIVPKWLRELKKLKFLFVSRNQFSGEIPSSICNVTFPSVFDLSYNNLSGRIPPCIGNFESLLVLDLRSNKLHGEIPESLFVEDSSLQNLNLNGNQLEGQIPRSLVNCTKLEILDIGNNEFNDTFPEWLESLPMLQVLVLRANKFHGLIGNPKPELSFQRNPKPIFPFQNLRIMDLSHNHFTGDLPTKYFDNFKAMKIDTRDVKLSYVGDKIVYYQASVRVTMKGFEFEFERIQTIFTTIDFSCNNFTGEIPQSLGKLKSLKGLNLSHNMLTGILPPSLGNMTNLEWLDLSSNELVGNIPVELADIPWLSNLNLSYNHLEGPIPRGTQFNTFLNESFEGNLNLCGFPLSKSCGGDTKPPEPSLVQDDEDDDDSSNWRIVMMGFASGLVIGISMGYMLLYSNGKLHWLSERILEEIEYRRAMRPKKRNARRSWRR